MSGDNIESGHDPLQRDQTQQTSKSEVIDLGPSDSEGKITSEQTLAQKLKKRGKRQNRRGPGSKKTKGRKDAIFSEAAGSVHTSYESKNKATGLSAATSFSTVDTVLLDEDEIAALTLAVPVLPHFELEEIAHDGDIFEVAIANDVINTGDRLICEAPAIAVREPTDIEAIYEGFCELTPHYKEAIWRLEANPAPHLENLMAHIMEMIKYMVDLYEKGNAGRTADEEKELDVMEPLLETYCKKWRLAARFSHNCYSLTNLPPSERHQIPADEPLSGLFPTVASLQHSCMPNCHVTYNHAIGKMTVHAVREIQPGEPLTVSNIGSDVYYLASAIDRAQRLDDVSSPPCNCPACDERNPKFAALNRYRAQVYGRAQWLSAKFSEMDIDSNTALRNSRSLETSVTPNRDDLSRALVSCREMLDFLKKAGCHDVELIRWRQPLVAMSRELGESIRAIGFAKANVQLAKICWGEDNEEYLTLKHELRKMEEEGRMQGPAPGGSRKGKGRAK
ncbi:hypothetical protein BDV96DRAFT_157463 [Lophiotrema nucula]|uniref:SET domain-containing protein n=1 Tax=Lophiotrema nucula TaxID=690887 RepID=A0A6A5Z139_9PLEO|nr:hypothetical protein BDV96DRAFT_157463 [Lophiotrema nucula]